ncbi:hypothetical protein BJ912DRAFT_808090, partial [Pholiota molesta]
CAVCLGCKKHDVRRCKATRLWDDSGETYAERSGGNLVRRRDGHPLCFDWQITQGCRSRSHDSSHLCSGCGSPRHGARSCPLAER